MSTNATVYTNLRVVKITEQVEEPLILLFSRCYERNEVPHKVRWQLSFAGSESELKEQFIPELGKHFEHSHCLSSFIYTTKDLSDYILKALEQPESLTLDLLKETGYDMYSMSQQDLQHVEKQYDGSPNDGRFTRVIFDSKDIHQLTQDVLDIKSSAPQPRYWFSNTLRSDHYAIPYVHLSDEIEQRAS